MTGMIFVINPSPSTVVTMAIDQAAELLWLAGRPAAYLPPS